MSNRDGYCIHGVYVGGCGIDWMCGNCEMGYDQWYPTTVWHNEVVIRGEKSDHVLHGNKRWYNTIEEANDSADKWESVFAELEDPSVIIANVVYSRKSGYWGPREQEQERHVTVYDSYNADEYSVYFRFDHEVEYLKEKVEDVNARLGDERFFVTPLTVGWSVLEVVEHLYGIAGDEE